MEYVRFGFASHIDAYVVTISTSYKSYGAKSLVINLFISTSNYYTDFIVYQKNGRECFFFYLYMPIPFFRGSCSDSWQTCNEICPAERMFPLARCASSSTDRAHTSSDDFDIANGHGHFLIKSTSDLQVWWWVPWSINRVNHKITETNLQLWT
jgi:hypothetical protein